MPYTRLAVHAVWAVKNREPLLQKPHKDLLCRHIRKYGRDKNIRIVNINGWLDHLHCLFFLAPDQSLATVMNLIKGESSYWANRNLSLDEKFGWQNEYYAVSVSRSHEKAVRKYIDNQEEHHRIKTFQEECDEFISKYGADGFEW